VQKRLVLLASLLLSAVVSAGEIQQASVEHKDGIYILELDVVVASQFAPCMPSLPIMRTWKKSVASLLRPVY